MIAALGSPSMVAPTGPKKGLGAEISYGKISILGRNRPKIHREIEVYITGLVLTSGTQEATREGAPLVSRAVNSRPLIIFKGCGSLHLYGGAR